MLHIINIEPKICENHTEQKRIQRKNNKKDKSVFDYVDLADNIRSSYTIELSRSHEVRQIIISTSTILYLLKGNVR